MPTLQIKNTHFYYEIHGTGQPLILVAGYTCDHTYWLPVLDGLSKIFQVVIFDNRGVGRTVDEGEALSALLLATDVIEIADKLKLKKPHIVGQSMGGSIVQTIGALYPQKISKLVILSSSAKWRHVAMMALKNSLSMRQKNIDFDILFDDIVPWIFGEKFLSHKKNIETFKQTLLNNKYMQSLQDQERQFEILVHFDGRENLARIKCDTLIGFGREDLLSLPEESTYLAEKIPHAQLLEFDCAHSVMQEVPHDLIDALTEFLQKKHR